MPGHRWPESNGKKWQDVDDSDKILNHSLFFTQHKQKIIMCANVPINELVGADDDFSAGLIKQIGDVLRQTTVKVIDVLTLLGHGSPDSYQLTVKLRI